MIPGHPGPGGRGGCREVRGRRPWRGRSRGRANSVGGRVECQLIMSAHHVVAVDAVCRVLHAVVHLPPEH